MSFQGVIEFMEASGGKLPFYSSWGSYTIIYLTEDNDTLCADCATEELQEYLADPSWGYLGPTAYGTYDEGPDIYCSGCNRVIESSYGDPDETEGEDS